MDIKDKLIIALDVDNLNDAKLLIEDLCPYVGCFKVGLELLTAVGAPEVIKLVHSFGAEVFYDGKFNDIPNTIAGATRALSKFNVKMFTVHASSGIEAMKAAVANKGKSLALAVTVLTSLDENEANFIFGKSGKDSVLQFAQYAKTAGCDGIICSPNELEFLRANKDLDDLIKVTPGIRPEWAISGDQKRTMTPREAFKDGASAIVIGRPITKPPVEIGKPVDAVKRILEEIGSIT